MSTPGSDRLDGGAGGRAWPFRPTELYRRVTGLFQRATKRTAGPPPGQAWDSASTLDEVTCLSEDQSVVLAAPDGKEYSLSDMIIYTFAKAKGWNVSETGQITLGTPPA